MPNDFPATLGELASSLKGFNQASFIALHGYPVLLRQNEAGAADRNATTTAFNTMALNAAKIRARARELLATPLAPVRKREGGNAFGIMVTLGRAPNNDIVFPDSQVSKFHASFSKNHEGLWTITDASSNGTWVDGQKLEARTPHVLRGDATIDLAHAVVLTLLSAERLFEEVENVWRREGHT